MTQITPEELVEFVRGRGDFELSTLAQKKPFDVRADGDGLVFIPHSTGKPHVHKMKWQVRLCEEFNRTNSLHPGDYRDLTVNASYHLAVIDAYLKTK